MIGGADGDIRRAVFDWLSRHRDETGSDTFTREELLSFEFRGQRVPLVGPTGIWKPAACELPLSIATIAGGPYDDSVDSATGRLTYAYRGTDAEHRDNRGLRTAMEGRVPLVYFITVVPGRYVAQFPVFIVGDRREALTFVVEIETTWAWDDGPIAGGRLPESDDARRSYATRVIRQRLHQVAFREKVIRAYQERCALCQLRHIELLDAAHIIADAADDGDPIVPNGISLCKLHHAAFDRMFFSIRPDYTVEVRASILTEVDGPMLVVGLQQIHEKQILLPRHRIDRPDPVRLQKRYDEFLRAS